MKSISDYLDELAKSYTSKPIGWAILKNPPFFKYHQPNPIFYKDFEGHKFFILTTGPKNYINNQKKGIKSRNKSRNNQSYKYNIILDKFISIPTIKFNHISSSFSHIIHYKEKKLYIIGGDVAFFAIFDLVNNKWKIIKNFKQILTFPRICYINKTIHIICNQIHYILNHESNEIQTMKSLKQKFRYFPQNKYELLCSKSRNKLYVFGGGQHNKIYQYDISNKIWEVSKFTLPFPMTFGKKSGTVAKMILFGNILVIFDFNQQCIYYLDFGDIKQNKFTQIKFDYIHGQYHKYPKVCITNDNHRVHFMNFNASNYHVSISLKELLPKYLVEKYTYLFVIGYVNNQWKTLNMDINKMCVDVVQLIGLFYGAVEDC